MPDSSTDIILIDVPSSPRGVFAKVTTRSQFQNPSFLGLFCLRHPCIDFPSELHSVRRLDINVSVARQSFGF
jgi:hypothetical protein